MSRHCVLVIIGFFAIFVEAKVYSSFAYVESEVSSDECISLAKQARKSVFKDELGEHVIDNSYTYSLDYLNINIVCLSEKNVIFISTSAQDSEPTDILLLFKSIYESPK